MAKAKTEIQARLDGGRRTLLAALEGLSERELTDVAAVGDWTIRDVLAHILAWEKVALQRLDLIESGQASQIQWVPAEEVDAQNARFHEAGRSLALDEVSRRLADRLALIRERVQSMTEEQLNIADTIDQRVWFPHSTYLHEEEHAAQIVQWRRGLETTEASA
ncbi:MAG: ClbS/DfsB family four-helix bundle protein [Dehalococcoidia bacterium]